MVGGCQGGNRWHNGVTACRNEIMRIGSTCCGMRNVECAVATKRRGVEAEAVSTKSSKLGTGRAKRNWNLPELRETGRNKRNRKRHR